MMFNKIRIRIAKTRFVYKLLANPVDLEIFKKKPSARFFSGLFVIGFSYIIGWPMVSVLAVLAVYFKKPLLFAIGSPITYGLSHLVFMLGAFIAGKDTIVYMNVFAKWSATKGLQRLLGPDAVAQSLNIEKQ